MRRKSVMSRAEGSSWFHLHDCKSVTVPCHLYIFGFSAWLVFNNPTVLVGNPGLVQRWCKQCNLCSCCTLGTLGCLGLPWWTANTGSVNTATVSTAIKCRRNSWIQHLFRDFCPLAFKRDEYARNSWDETVARMMPDYDEDSILQSDGLQCNFICSFC